mmetsp:Transcript_53026/g.116020  ORF Transcript_53026/g.116020 Transcript_53026/m.116020 type:complete len:224 (-) Transcript_53026:39-710(-)
MSPCLSSHLFIMPSSGNPVAPTMSALSKTRKPMLCSPPSTPPALARAKDFFSSSNSSSSSSSHSTSSSAFQRFSACPSAVGGSVPSRTSPNMPRPLGGRVEAPTVPGRAGQEEPDSSDNACIGSWMSEAAAPLSHLAPRIEARPLPRRLRAANAAKVPAVMGAKAPVAVPLLAMAPASPAAQGGCDARPYCDRLLPSNVRNPVEATVSLAAAPPSAGSGAMRG